MELISREDAIRELILLRLPDNETNYCVKAHNDAIERSQAVINQLPTIESRPKGEWKQVSWKLPIAREVELLFHYKCDNCDKEVRIDHIERYNYCPNCGADMRGKE